MPIECKLLHFKVVYEDIRRVLFQNQYRLLKFISKSQLLLNSTTTYPENKILLLCDNNIGSSLCQDKLKSKTVWIFQRCLLFMLQSCSCLFSPLCGNVEEETSKICRQQISVPITTKKKSVSRFCGQDCYSVDYTPGKLLTLTKSTRQ